MCQLIDKQVYNVISQMGIYMSQHVLHIQSGWRKAPITDKYTQLELKDSLCRINQHNSNCFIIVQM